MSFLGFSASKNKSWATIKVDIPSWTGPETKIIRSFNKREKISNERSPLDVCSTTIGTNVLL
jgi:hypothetical protein